jgi:N-acetylglucosamine-6-phosphate deacetylase
MDADITVLDRGLSVMLTMVEGRVIYEKEVR